MAQLNIMYSSVVYVITMFPTFFAKVEILRDSYICPTFCQKDTLEEIFQFIEAILSTKKKWQTVSKQLQNPKSNASPPSRSVPSNQAHTSIHSKYSYPPLSGRGQKKLTVIQGNNLSPLPSHTMGSPALPSHAHSHSGRRRNNSHVSTDIHPTNDPSGIYLWALCGAHLSGFAGYQ